MPRGFPPNRISRLGRGKLRGRNFAVFAQANPDVLILDVDMGDINGVEVARQAVKLYPLLRVVALSGHAERIYVEEMLRAGAHGYVVKSAGAEELILAIREVAGGRNFLSPAVTKFLVRHIQIDPAAVTRRRASSGGARRTFSASLPPASGPPSAEVLGAGRGTVEVHRRNIKQKLGPLFPGGADPLRHP